MDVSETIIEKIIKSRAENADDLSSIKRGAAEKYKTSCPSNIDLLKTYRRMVKNNKLRPGIKIANLLRTRPVRSLSGIVNISVLTKPYPCPGKCLYCPIEKGIPKSYVSGEPAVERAKILRYNPYWQVKKRLEALELEGHPTDKVELRVIGGTWSFYPKKYRDRFIKRCFDACNGNDYTETPSLSTAQRLNEKAKHRIVGLSIETRPDFINRGEIKNLREFGATMVELGVQSIDDDILKLNKRGHGVKEISEATKLLKDAGFKVLYQMMPNLPGSTPARDLKVFKKLFSDSRFKPDLLKIYPCALIKKSPLYKRWKEKKYKPYEEKRLIKLIKSIKETIPHYVRIQRITRDIPARSIVAGPAKISNIRQLLKVRCKCIRCREIKGGYDPKEKIYLFRQNYQASDGEEIFLSFEDKKRTKLYSLLRLRIGNGTVSRYRAIIREIHTYGQQLSIADKGPDSVCSPQHKGLGKKLVKEAEKITKTNFGLDEIAAISGIGAREYWKKLGYKLKNTYMVKEI